MTPSRIQIEAYKGWLLSRLLSLPPTHLTGSGSPAAFSTVALPGYIPDTVSRTATEHTAPYQALADAFLLAIKPSLDVTTTPPMHPLEMAALNAAFDGDGTADLVRAVVREARRHRIMHLASVFSVAPIEKIAAATGSVSPAGAVEFVEELVRPDLCLRLPCTACQRTYAF